MYAPLVVVVRPVESTIAVMGSVELSVSPIISLGFFPFMSLTILFLICEKQMSLVINEMYSERASTAPSTILL
jgi:hypothetical protein